MGAGRRPAPRRGLGTPRGRIRVRGLRAAGHPAPRAPDPLLRTAHPAKQPTRLAGRGAAPPVQACTGAVPHHSPFALVGPTLALLVSLVVPVFLLLAACLLKGITEDDFRLLGRDAPCLSASFVVIKVA